MSNLHSFINDDYISIAKSGDKKEGVGNNTIPCVACHHTLDRGDVFQSQLLEPQSPAPARILSCGSMQIKV